MAAYDGLFVVGQRVQVCGTDKLESFKQDWRYHNPLTDDQLSYATIEAIVAKVGYYYGGDGLYVLTNVPGIWHECCLQAAA